MENIRIIIYNVIVLVILFSSCHCQCHNVADCFQNVIHGRYIKSIVKSKFGNRYSDCFRECVHHTSNCKSFNYQIFSGLCELNSDVPTAGEISPEDGFIHSLIPNKPDSMDPCSSSSCRASEVCVAMTSCSSTCVKECGNIVTPAHGQVVSTKLDVYYTPGEELDVTCDVGFNKINDLTCLASGKWSDTFLCVDVCTFETSCASLELDPTSDTPFILLSGPTPSDYTGCSADHTTGVGQYYYMEASDPAQPGEVSRMKTKSAIGAGIQVCVRLWYHMYGNSMGSLFIKTKEIGGETRYSFMIANGPQVNSWLEKVQTIPPHAAGFYIVIEARRGTYTKSDICIDDVSIIRC